MKKVEALIRKSLDYFIDSKVKVFFSEGILQIVNYDEITKLEPTEINLKTKDGKIVIKGSNMKIKNIFDFEVSLEGEINTIEFR